MTERSATVSRPPVVAAIIPALNEAESIAHVVQALQRLGIEHVRVVDNGSTDSTAAIARQSGAEVLTEPARGYGAACWRGLQDLPSGVEWIVFCDADGSDDLARLPEFLQLTGQYDFILGARQSSSAEASGVSWAQRIGNAIATTGMALGWGHRYRDMGPFRLIRRDSLDRMRMRDRTWGWTLEMQVRAIEEGLRIIELRVRSLPRQGGHSKIGGSLVGGIRAGAKILWTLAALFLRRGPRHPVR